MPTHHVLILGAGAAGVAAATALARHEDIHVTLVGRTHETPYIRMHITGVAFGPTLPETIHAPLPPVTVLADTATHLDPISRIVHLASGAQLRYDAVIIATGSRPDTLTPGLPGRHTPAARHQVVTLHSIQDAQQIREHLTRTAGPSRVAIYGGGFTGAETASALHAAGHHVALISRSRIPGRASFGAQIAAHITGIHRGKITTFLGRTITADRDRSPLLGITLDDTTTLSADLLITALGNAPTAPGPFSSGVPVDDRLRSTAPHVYAAGSTAIHRDDHLGIWRLDHWADAAAQGQHAAAAVLHDRTGAADPGPYRPRSSYTSLIHGTAITGIGYTMTPATEGQGPGPGTLVTHTLNGALVGVSGVDAVATVHETAQHLHESAA
ncbi:NAD(P)/FAD-dependent oxidoreductase [Microbacterium sp. OR21]|uniref:FAD-dependent oxidoreductase n=1 Tax=Microbacterium sp. OR21 TaxID=3095346 RepID=UPI0039B610B3